MTRRLFELTDEQRLTARSALRAHAEHCDARAGLYPEDSALQRSYVEEGAAVVDALEALDIDRGVPAPTP